MRLYGREPGAGKRGDRDVPLAAAEQQPDEGRPEGLVEHRVDDGVDGGADVAQPQAHHHHVLGHVAVRAGREEDVEDEEGRPAQDECEEYQAEYLGGLLLGGHGVGSHGFPLHPPGQQPGTNGKLEIIQVSLYSPRYNFF